MNQIVASNRWIGARVLTARAALNVGKTLHVFQNDFTPDSSVTDPAVFFEASFPGYAPVNLDGRWGPGSYVQDGEYQSQAGPFFWGVPASGLQTAYGWWIDDGTYVQLSFRFAVPIVVSPHTPELSFVVRFQSWAKSAV